MSDKITGSCLCGAVRYTVDGPFKTAANCHCGICRKTLGSAFQTLAFADEAKFQITAGREQLVAYRVTERAVKHFCGTCGTPVFNRHSNFPGNVLIPVGSLDDPASVVPAVNVFCESMLPWVGKIAELKSFAREPTR